ncbi:MAG: hypothetical protein ACOC1K_06480 [Nanoarchaeota archaeon]
MLNNYLVDINISYKDIEKQIGNYSLKFPSTRNKKVERYIKFPIFVDEFYTLLKEKGKIPLQKEFSEYYIKKHKGKDCIKKLNDKEIKALIARLYRAFPSYIRDLHFGKLLKSKTNFADIIANSTLDVDKGIDVLIRYNQHQYGVCLYIDTKRSQNFRKSKIKYQKDGYVYIELPLNLDDCKQVGEFYLYSEKEIIQLLNTILKIEEDGVI